MWCLCFKYYLIILYDIILTNKTTFDLVVIKPIRNGKTEERRKSQTVIVPDTEKIDADQQSNGKDANIFLFCGQGATRTSQTNRQ